MDKTIAGLIAVALAVLCCALPLLITAGVLGGLAGWLTSGWGVAIVVAGVLMIAVAVFTWWRHAGPKSSGLDDAGHSSDGRSRDRHQPAQESRK
jgi:sugar phosphate permease